MPRASRAAEQLGAATAGFDLVAERHADTLRRLLAIADRAASESRHRRRRSRTR
jgi:hypothetical protein